MKILSEIAAQQEQRVSPERIEELIVWIKAQVSHLTEATEWAREHKDYRWVVQCESMRDMFLQCLDKLGKQPAWN